MIDSMSTDVPITDVPFRTLVAGTSASQTEPINVRRIVLRVAAAAVGVMLLVGVVGIVVVQRMAEQEALNDASQLTDLLAKTVIMPALEDSLLDQDPGAIQRLDAVVRQRVVADEMFVRVKIWSPQGVVLYSDEPALIGQQFTLGAERRAVLSAPATVAEVSNLTAAENAFERPQGQLVEVYRPVWTPSGSPVLFETYTTYASVTVRTGNLWRGFGGTIISSLLLFVVLLTPLLWTLVDRLRKGREARELLLQRALDASLEERQRIAADLHDGVVQELVAASLLVASARGSVDGAAADQLTAAAAAVRSSVSSLRTLLVDIYPPNLESAGLEVALDDLAATVRGRGLASAVTVDPAATALLSTEQQRFIYRTVQECLRNVVKHADANQVDITLTKGSSDVVLEIKDDGEGMTDEVVDGASEPGHLGLRLLADLATEHGATLSVATAPGRGTAWRVEIPT
jgi:two-component sensor histidine kinase